MILSDYISLVQSFPRQEIRFFPDCTIDWKSEECAKPFSSFSLGDAIGRSSDPLIVYDWKRR